MAGISSTLSRKDLKFMAEDIGPELVPFLKPEDIVKGMNAKKRHRLFKAMLAELAEGEELEQLLAELNPEMQKRVTLALHVQAVNPTESREKNALSGVDKT